MPSGANAVTLTAELPSKQELWEVIYPSSIGHRSTTSYRELQLALRSVQDALLSGTENDVYNSWVNCRCPDVATLSSTLFVPDRW